MCVSIDIATDPKEKQKLQLLLTAMCVMELNLDPSIKENIKTPSFPELVSVCEKVIQELGWGG
jgi:hypothetical protein